MVAVERVIMKMTEKRQVIEKGHIAVVRAQERKVKRRMKDQRRKKQENW